MSAAHPLPTNSRRSRGRKRCVGGRGSAIACDRGCRAGCLAICEERRATGEEGRATSEEREVLTVITFSVPRRLALALLSSPSPFALLSSLVKSVCVFCGS